MLWGMIRISLCVEIGLGIPTPFPRGNIPKGSHAGPISPGGKIPKKRRDPLPATDTAWYNAQGRKVGAIKEIQPDLFPR